MISSRLDGALDSEMLVEMDAHLAGCPSCCHRWMLFQEIASDLYYAPSLAPSPEFTARVLARLDRAPATHKSSRPFWALLTVVGGLLGVTAITTVMVAWIIVWPVLSYPVLVGKVANLLALFVSVVGSIGRALWLGFSVMDNQDISLATGAMGLVALFLLAVWVRVVSSWWDLGGERRVA